MHPSSIQKGLSMFRVSIVVASFFLSLSGCGDQHQAEVEAGRRGSRRRQRTILRNQRTHTACRLIIRRARWGQHRPVEATTGPVVDMGSMTLAAQMVGFARGAAKRHDTGRIQLSAR